MEAFSYLEISRFVGYAVSPGLAGIFQMIKVRFGGSESLLYESPFALLIVLEVLSALTALCMLPDNFGKKSEGGPTLQAEDRPLSSPRELERSRSRSVSMPFHSARSISHARNGSTRSHPPGAGRRSRLGSLAALLEVGEEKPLSQPLLPADERRYSAIDLGNGPGAAHGDYGQHALAKARAEEAEELLHAQEQGGDEVWTGEQKVLFCELGVGCPPPPTPIPVQHSHLPSILLFLLYPRRA